MIEGWAISALASAVATALVVYVFLLYRLASHSLNKRNERWLRGDDACPECDICGREQFYDYGRYWCPRCDFKEADDE